MPDELHPHAFFATDEEWLPNISDPSSPVATAPSKETAPAKAA